MLPIKKIYIDSQYRTLNSISSSDFEIDLKESFSFPDNTVYYIDDVTIPHSWYVVEKDVNDRLYFYTLDTTTNIEVYSIVTLDYGNYSGDDLKEEINIKLNAEINIADNPNIYAVTYSFKTNAITIDSRYSNIQFNIFTTKQLKLTGIHEKYNNLYNINSINDINEILGNYSYKLIIFPNNYTSQSLNLQSINNIYLSSNLGNYNSIGPRLESSIIKKIPVTANKNSFIFDQVLTANDYGDCSKQSIRLLHFTLNDSNGNNLILHGSNVSFSIIFSRLDPNM